MLYGSVSSKQIIAKVIRDLHLQDAERWVDMVEWVGECMAFIGAFDQFINKNLSNVEIKNFRVIMPCDLYSITSISHGGVPLQYLGGSFDFAFHCSTSPNLKSKSHKGYTINGAYINTNFTNSKINIAYQAFNTDKEGWPMVPDEQSYREACFRYIVMKMKYPEWLLGKISDTKWEMIDRDWHFYCAQARAVANMPNIDQMEAMKNNWLRLVPNIQEHSTFFNGLGLPTPSVNLTITPSTETVTAIS